MRTLKVGNITLSARFQNPICTFAEDGVPLFTLHE